VVVVVLLVSMNPPGSRRLADAEPVDAHVGEPDGEAHHGAGRYLSATGPPPPPFSLYPEDLAAMMTGAHPVR
jgi:hypothetical protein